jgi:hypothetical protein
MRRTAPFVLLAILAIGCEQLIGADFDVKLADSGSGGKAATGGSGGTSSGGGAGEDGTGGAGDTGGSSGSGGEAGLAGTAGMAGMAAAGSGGTGASGGAGGTGGSGGSGGSGGLAGMAGGGGETFPIVVNEIRGNSPDYIELMNVGSEPFDLGNYGVADDDAGLPKLSEAYRFPAPTIVPAGGRILIVTGEQLTPSPGSTTSCSGYPAPCFQAVFGISNSGDHIYVLDAAQTDLVRSDAAYPAAANVIQRIPDGTGAFMPGGTPNAPNG